MEGRVSWRQVGKGGPEVELMAFMEMDLKGCRGG